MASTRSTRHLGLDAIRALAIGLVLLHHVGLRFPSSVTDPVARLLVWIGWAGVDIFFAISGFLITRVLLETSRPADIAQFFRRRLFRIVPLYAVALLVFLAAALALRVETEHLDRLWITALFLTGWAIPWLGADGVAYTISWSLSVEEFAYVLLGLTALVARDALPRALWGGLIVAVAVRGWMVFVADVPPGLVYYFPPARLDGIALGGLMVVRPFRGRQPPPWVPLVATLAVIGVLSRVGRHNPWVATFGYTLIGWCAAWLVATVASLPSRAGGRWITLAADLGLVSYFVYLFHVFVVAATAVLCRKLGWQQPSFYLVSIVVLLATYAGARMSWTYFELPLIRRGHRTG